MLRVGQTEKINSAEDILLRHIIISTMCHMCVMNVVAEAPFGVSLPKFNAGYRTFKIKVIHIL
jgi:hypothetical protein